jgi:hypothetical protein
MSVDGNPHNIKWALTSLWSHLGLLSSYRSISQIHENSIPMLSSKIVTFLISLTRALFFWRIILSARVGVGLFQVIAFPKPLEIPPLPPP